MALNGVWHQTCLWDGTQSNGGYHTGKRDIKERKANGETLWMSISKDETLTKYTTTRRVDGDKVCLAAYLPLNEEDQDTFTPARIKYASIFSFKARVLNDAEEVACGLGMEIHSLFAVTFGDSAGTEDSLCNELLERNW